MTTPPTWQIDAQAEMFSMRLKIWELAELMRQTPEFLPLGNEIETSMESAISAFFETPNTRTLDNIRDVWSSFAPRVAVFCDAI